MAMSAGSHLDTGENFSRKSLMGEPGTPRNAALILIAGVAIYQMIGALSLDLIVGEAYYLSSARQLHLGYFDQPPISLWMIWFAKTFFQSEAPFFLRLPFVLTYAGANWLIYRLGARYSGEWAGVASIAVMNSAILFLLSIGQWLQPEAPLVLFWLATVWVLADIFFDDADARPYWKWAWVGVWLGLTFLTKYHAVFLVFGAGLFALTYAPARRWITHPGPYMAIGIAAVIALPVVIWNLQNNWASFSFQGSRAFGDGFHWDWLLRMILGQLLYQSPWIVLPALFAAGRAALRGPAGIFPDEAEPGFAWFLVMLAIGPIFFFTMVAAGSDTQFHFHWQAPGYMMIYPILGAWIASAFEDHKRLISWWLGLSAALTFVIVSALISHTSTGWIRHAFNLGPEIVDPTAGAIEWRELGEWYEQSGVLDENRTMIAGLYWTDCGQIDKPLAGRLPLACLSSDPRNIAFNIDLGVHDGWDAYIVAPYVSFDQIRARVGEFFESMHEVTSFDIVRGGIPEFRNVRIMKGEGLKLDRAIPVDGAATVQVRRLPRTRIAGLRGRIRLPVDAGPTSILIDGEIVETVTPDPNGYTTFLVSLDEGAWTVGFSSAEVSLAPANPIDTASFGFEELSVNLR